MAARTLEQGAAYAVRFRAGHYVGPEEVAVPETPFILTNPANGDHVAAFVMGAAEGPNRPSMYLPMGDLMGVRNIQGGTAGKGGNLNLDLGAGSTKNPGDIVLNWDVGRRTRIYNGRKRLIADFAPGGIDFYVPVRFHRGARGI